MSQITHLYIKTHNVTGLKYFGKTQQDPFKYSGSGKYWKLHLKKYGYNISTKVVASFKENEFDELVEFSLFFSEFYNIVESNEWANLMPENGVDGGGVGKNNPMYGKKHSEETKQKIKEKKKNWFVNNIHHMKNKTHTLEARNKISESRIGKNMKQETKDKISNSTKGKKLTRDHIENQNKSKLKRRKISNGIEIKYVTILEGFTMPNGWHFTNKRNNKHDYLVIH